METEGEGDVVMAGLSQITVPSAHPYIQSISITADQTGLLDVFAACNLAMTGQAIDDYCQPKGLMKNAFIDSINESFYELLDDILIEQDDYNYSIQLAY